MVPVKTHRRLTLSVVQVMGILLVWFIAITYLHHYVHGYINQITGVLNTPLLQLVGAILLASILLYLLILSLPVLPNLSVAGFLTLIVWVALIVSGHALTHLGLDRAENILDAMQASVGLTGLALLAVVYAVFLAMPFVAGVEIGLLIMAMFGLSGVVVAYCGTLLGLSLAFWAGRILPGAFIGNGLRKLNFVNDVSDLDEFLQRSISGAGRLSSLWATLFRNRYLTIAVLLNCPGNAVVGGGGGLALLSGTSKDVSWLRFLAMITIATSPVPILVLMGLLNIEVFMEHTGVLHEFLTWAKGYLP
jgi:hypothetical protein